MCFVVVFVPRRMMQVQAGNMMDPNPAAAFWGARHAASWPGHHAHSAASANVSAHNDPKMAEKLMTELQVRGFGLRATGLYLVFYVELILIFPAVPAFITTGLFGLKHCQIFWYL